MQLRVDTLLSNLKLETKINFNFLSDDLCLQQICFFVLSPISPILVTGIRIRYQLISNKCTCFAIRFMLRFKFTFIVDD